MCSQPIKLPKFNEFVSWSDLSYQVLLYHWGWQGVHIFCLWNSVDEQRLIPSTCNHQCTPQKWYFRLTYMLWQSYIENTTFFSPLQLQANDEKMKKTQPLPLLVFKVEKIDQTPELWALVARRCYHRSQAFFSLLCMKIVELDLTQISYS